MKGIQFAAKSTVKVHVCDHVGCRYSGGIFQIHGSNNALSLKQKLVLLTVLVEASRVPELQALDLRYHFY